MIFNRIAFATLLTTALFVSALASAADASVAAMDMVKKQRLGGNFAALSYRVVKNTPTYRNIAYTIGAEKADILVKGALDKARPKYQAQWDQNLAASYAEFFSPDELESIANSGKASPYANKFFSMQGEVGKGMQTRSTPILRALLAEALKNAFTQLMPRAMSQPMVNT